MAIIKVLKRKDAASLIVAIVVATTIGPVLSAVTIPLSNALSGTDLSTPGTGWQVQYLDPIVHAILQIVALVVGIWLYVFVHETLKKS